MRHDTADGSRGRVLVLGNFTYVHPVEPHLHDTAIPIGLIGDDVLDDVFRGHLLAWARRFPVDIALICSWPPQWTLPLDASFGSTLPAIFGNHLVVRDTRQEAD